MHSPAITPEEALERLRAGNARYLTARTCPGDVSPARRLETCRDGQHPWAVVVTCSDSRVIPEAVFSAGIGELFVVRTAGNVIGPNELGSVDYAVSHLGVGLVLILGHTGCGAVDAAIHGHGEGLVRPITDAIRAAIGPETDPARASALNALASARALRESIPAAYVRAAVYRIDSGEVDFLPES